MTAEKVLVTGGAGFIGSFLVDRLVERGDRVTILDCLAEQVHPEGKPDTINAEAVFIEGNVLDRTLMADLVSKNDIIYHLAAAVGVAQSQYHVDHFVRTNTGATAQLLDILVNEKHDVRKIVVASSNTIYGEGQCERPSDGKRVRPGLRGAEQMERSDWEPRCPATGEALVPVPTPETAAWDPNTIYAMTKGHQEEMVLNIGKTYDIPAVATRFFNVFGPRQSLSNPYTGVSAIFMSRIKNDSAPVVYEDGEQSRDFISVHDVVSALMAIKDSSAIDYESVNVGTGQARSISDVARTIARVCGKEIEPEIGGQFRKGDVRHCYADNGKIRDRLGWEPKIAFEEGMRELVEWSESQEAHDGFEKATAELKQKGLI